MLKHMTVIPISLHGIECVCHVLILQRDVNKIRLKLQGSPLEPKKRDASSHSEKTKKILFNEEPAGQISDEASQPRGLAVVVGEDLEDKDFTGYEWAL